MHRVSRNWYLLDNRDLMCLLMTSWKAPTSHKPRVVVDLPIMIQSRGNSAMAYMQNFLNVNDP